MVHLLHRLYGVDAPGEVGGGQFTVAVCDGSAMSAGRRTEEWSGEAANDSHTVWV